MAPPPCRRLSGQHSVSQIFHRNKKKGRIYHAQENETGRPAVLCSVLCGWDGGWEARKKARRRGTGCQSPATPRQLGDGPLLSSSSWGWGHLKSLGEMVPPPPQPPFYFCVPVLGYKSFKFTEHKRSGRAFHGPTAWAIRAEETGAGGCSVLPAPLLQVALPWGTDWRRGPGPSVHP